MIIFYELKMDNSRILDDLSRVAGGAFSVFSAIGKQIQNNVKDQMGDSFTVANDDVARLQGVVTKLRIEQEDLKSRIAELESLVGVSKKAPAKKAPVKKVAVKKKKSSR
jgi:BMFP domain-containing protein YqiC